LWLIISLLAKIVEKGLDKLFALAYNSSMMNEIKMYSTREAAQHLGISIRRVQKLLKEGRIKGKKLDGTWVVFELSYTKKRG